MGGGDGCGDGVKILAISDLHGNFPAIEPCDLLLIAGDLCPFRDHRVSAQSQFINDEFAAWLKRIPAEHVVGIAGNHDFVFERSPQLIRDDLRWTYLQDQETCLAGLRIYGTPWCPIFRNWAFNLDEGRLAEKWDRIPAEADIVITHTPPFGYGDLTTDGLHVGSLSLRDRLPHFSARLVVFGHIHEAQGDYTFHRQDESAMRLANVAHLNARGEPVHAPVPFKIEPRQNSLLRT